ncbi:hypothetical protein, variant [Sphaeroforma arctica JP610]|uniref:Uncharacterized protein n=1 Tax=Sphaeroforma arctica JP610 TaxID=667725 RepID=A0A0L0GE75_9EUKA|nr:hypothetical protein, variant [Sphaeroforma arctica JP610]KNC87327.1 hypothetical protein, variant [Sphaeroforma arctica JP610]|eukprot:XP_014161229.1 hypothetical protein, variant [Sphaeroforma arctica JP610]
MKTFCGIVLAAIAVVVAQFHVHMSPNITFSTVPLRGFPNQEILVKLNAPAGYEGKLKIEIDGSSAVGGGKIVGDNEVKFDGGEPVSKGRATFGIACGGSASSKQAAASTPVLNVLWHVSFQAITLSRALLRLHAEIDGETVVSHIITIAPETQCNGKQWFYVSSCDDCVHLTDLNCQYCPGLQTCVKGNIHGPYDPVACPEWFVSVCFVLFCTNNAVKSVSR